jgi:hypothetical protein
LRNIAENFWSSSRRQLNNQQQENRNKGKPMDAQVINFKPYSSGAMIGFFDLAVSGLVVTFCKAFKKGDKLWFGWPSEKIDDEGGEGKWRDIVTCAEPVNRHLQAIVRGQFRVLLDNGGNGSVPRLSASYPVQRRFKTPEGQDLSEYRSTGKEDDIPF